jgi:hypothetical protein
MKKNKDGGISLYGFHSLCFNVSQEIKNPRYALLGAAGELQPSNYL